MHIQLIVLLNQMSNCSSISYVQFLALQFKHVVFNTFINWKWLNKFLFTQSIEFRFLCWFKNFSSYLVLGCFVKHFWCVNIMENIFAIWNYFVNYPFCPLWRCYMRCICSLVIVRRPIWKYLLYLFLNQLTFKCVNFLYDFAVIKYQVACFCCNCFIIAIDHLPLSFDLLILSLNHRFFFLCFLVFLRYPFRFWWTLTHNLFRRSQSCFHFLLYSWFFQLLNLCTDSPLNIVESKELLLIDELLHLHVSKSFFTFLFSVLFWVLILQELLGVRVVVLLSTIVLNLSGNHGCCLLQLYKELLLGAVTWCPFFVWNTEFIIIFWIIKCLFDLFDFLINLNLDLFNHFSGLHAKLMVAFWLVNITVQNWFELKRILPQLLFFFWNRLRDLK